MCIEWLDSLCFGTNDISAKLYGYERDGQEISLRKEASILTPKVKEIIKSYVLKSQKLDYYNPFRMVGVCGYHASVPENVAVFQELGINYLSCLPEEIQTIRAQLPQTNKLNEQPDER